MKSRVIWYSLFFFPLSLFGQDILFNRSYDYHQQWEIASAIKELNDGYILAIRTAASTYEANRVVLYRLDEWGDTLWTKSHFQDSTVFRVMGGNIEEDEEGNFVITGCLFYPQYDQEDGGLLKFSPQGDIIWLKSFGGEEADGFHSYKKTPDGGYILGGWSFSNSPQGDFYLVKTDSDGEMEWETWIGGSGWQIGYSVDFTPDGGYVISGRGGIPPDAIDIAVAKCDGQGNQLWSYIYGGPYDNDAPHQLKVLSDGNILISGAMGNGIIQTQKGRDAFLLKIDQHGSEIWEEVYDEVYTISHGSNIIELQDSSIVVAGIRYLDENSTPKSTINKYDSNGTPIWNRTYAGGNPFVDDYLYYITSTSDGGFLAFGSTYDPNWDNVQEAWLLKLDSEGYTCDTVGCLLVDITEVQQPSSQLNVFPNPNSGKFTIQWATESPIELQVLSSTGQQVWTGVGSKTGTMELSLDHLPRGLYVLSLQNEYQQKYQKFIIAN